MKPRAKVKPEFIELVCNTAKQELYEIRDTAQAFANNSDYMLKKGEVIQRLSSLVRRNAMAIDRLKTNLRGLDYKSFSVYNRGEAQYLVGKTNPIVMAQYARSTSTKPRAYFDAGAYWVYINVGDFLAKKLNKVHMIPEKSPSALNRHPHITCRNNEDRTSPLDFEPVICWSGFAQLVSGAADDHDIVSLFRYIHLYLGRWAVGSEFGNCKHISFIEDYPLETP